MALTSAQITVPYAVQRYDTKPHGVFVTTEVTVLGLVVEDLMPHEDTPLPEGLLMTLVHALTSTQSRAQDMMRVINRECTATGRMALATNLRPEVLAYCQLPHNRRVRPHLEWDAKHKRWILKFGWITATHTAPRKHLVGHRNGNAGRRELTQCKWHGHSGGRVGMRL